LQYNVCLFKSKIFDFGTGANADSFDLSFNGVTPPLSLFLENQISIGTAYAPTGYQYYNFGNGALSLNTWYHIVWVLSNPVIGLGAAYTATWTAYINGNIAGIYVGGNFPMPVVRTYSYLGKSDWSDNLAIVMYDVVRIYDYTLTPAQIQALSALYIPSTISSSSRYRSSSSSSGSSAAVVPGTAGSSSSSSLSSGAIAGIVIGCVVGALLICCLLWFVVCGSGRTSKKSSDSGDGKYAQHQSTRELEPDNSEGDVEMQHQETETTE